MDWVSTSEARLRERPEPEPSPPEARGCVVSARGMTVAELAESVVGCETVLAAYFDHDVPSHQIVRFQKALGDLLATIKPDPDQSALFIQSDGRDMTVWHDRPDRDPEALLTEHQAGPVLWAHLMATLPTRDEPQPEPLDPAVRVRDSRTVAWARIGTVWVNRHGQDLTWDDLIERRGPLTIEPTPEPTPDERPFKVGDRVRISRSAVWIDDKGGKRVSNGRGDTGRITRVLGDPADHAIVHLEDCPAARRYGYSSDVRLTDLTHADAPC